MSSDWKICMLGELGTIKTGKTPASSLGDGFGGTVPFVTPGDMNGQKWITDTDRCLNERGLASVSSSLMPPRSVAVSCIGSDMGKASLLSRPSVTNQQINTIAVDESRFNAEFVYYDLSVRQQELKAAASGSATPILNKGHFSAFEISIPPRATQDKIAEILGKLDDRIAVNRRINQTLEAMAQAIFQSWFVDFYPVKAKIAAKAEGRDPLRAAMSAICGKADAELDALPPEQYEQLAATAALFPDEMEASELGEIPRGWGISTVGQVAEVIKGKSYSSKDLIDNTQTALVTLKSFERGGGFRMDGFKPYVGVFKPAQVVEPGELIVAYTDVTQAAELIGRPAIVVGVNKYQTLVASLDVGIVRPHLDQVSRQFLFGLFSTDAFQAHTFAHTSGTTVLHLAKEGVPSFRFARPPIDLINNFSDCADPTVAMKQSTLDQIAALRELRDALLPKLLSGELKVQHSEPEAVA